MLADAAMSLDNVVALAAIAGGALWLLALGVLISIPIIAYGAVILSAIIRRAPEIIAVGAAFLGWIAGAMAVSDPLVAGWVQSDAPALAVFAPALLALFVVVAGKGAGERRPGRRQAGPRPPSAPRRPADRRSDARLLHRRLALSPAIVEPAAQPEGMPAYSVTSPAAQSRDGWTEERVVVAGFVLLAFLAGLIIFIASFFDSLT